MCIKSFWAVNQGMSLMHKGIHAQHNRMVDKAKIPPPKYQIGLKRALAAGKSDDAHTMV